MALMAFWNQPTQPLGVSSFFISSQENRTSLAEKVPWLSWKGTPWRSFMRKDRPLGSRFHSVASCGTYLPVSASMPTRYSYIGRMDQISRLPTMRTSLLSRAGGTTAMISRWTDGLAAASLAGACGAAGAGLAASVLGAAPGALVGVAAGAAQAA